MMPGAPMAHGSCASVYKVRRPLDSGEAQLDFHFLAIRIIQSNLRCEKNGNKKRSYTIKSRPAKI